MKGLKMRLAIVGSRNICNNIVYKIIEQVINKATANIDEIVTGGAIGVDTIAEEYANNNNIKTTIFKPMFKKFGMQSYFIRNRLIIDNADFVLAIWDMQSRGTKYTINYAKSTKKKILIIDTHRF